MAPLFGIIVAVILTIVAAITGFIWAWPFAGLALALALGYMAVQRKGANSPITIERGRRQEPTGMPRPSRSDVETTNERVGQG